MVGHKSHAICALYITRVQEAMPLGLQKQEGTCKRRSCPNTLIISLSLTPCRSDQNNPRTQFGDI